MLIHMILNKKLMFSIATCSFLFVACTSDELGFSNGDPNWELTTSIKLTRGEEEAVSGINDFGYKLMVKAYESSENGEFCISPVSLSIYLSMLANASTGDCHDQILQALGSENTDELNSLSRKLMQYLPNDDNESSLSINNHFWVAKHNKVPKDFISTMNHYFNCGVDYVDFNKESTVRNINQWVRDCTGGKIPGIMFENWESYRDREMVSANTVYFKGDWDDTFSKQKTEPGIFHSPQGDVEVDMMHKTHNDYYFENEYAKFILRDFEGYDNFMEFYLPAEGTELNQLVSLLSPSMMSDIYKSGDICNVTLSMPKFRKNFETNINDILGKIGITSLCEADLSPMGLKKIPQYLIHNTSIKVDEKGAELAAVTANTGKTTNIPPKYKEVTLNLNRPFVYVVRNRKTGAILMAGTVTDPR